MMKERPSGLEWKTVSKTEETRERFRKTRPASNSASADHPGGFGGTGRGCVLNVKKVAGLFSKWRWRTRVQRGVEIVGTGGGKNRQPGH